MSFYLTIYIILLFLSYGELCFDNKRYSKALGFFAIFFVFVLSFVRWETGTDWGTYYDFFNKIRIPWESLDIKEINKFEFGFLVLNHLAKYLFDSYTMALLLQAIIIYLSWSIVLYKVSSYPIFSFFIFYCMSFASMLFVRQNIAMAILAFSVLLIIQKRFWLFSIVVCLACFFHRSSIVFFIAYPLFYRYFSLGKILLLIIVFSMLGIVVGKMLLAYIGQLGLGIISVKIENYMAMGETDHSSDYSIAQILMKGAINRIFLFIVYMCFLHRIRKADFILNGLINLCLLGIMLYFLLMPISLSLGRITAYFDIMQILVLPYLFKYSKNIGTKNVLFVIISGYLFFRLLSAVYSFYDYFVPYQTIFS